MKRMQMQTGFTTLELMVVIGIVAILVTLAVPNFFGRLPGKRLESAAGDINAALQTARLAAVRENTCAVIEFSSSNNNYRIFVDNGGTPPANTPANACNKTRDTGEPAVKAGKLPPGVDLVSDALIKFDSRGFPDSEASISLRIESGSTWTVKLNITGSTRINRD